MFKAIFPIMKVFVAPVTPEPADVIAPRNELDAY